jgi:hypothetical protein
MPDLVMDENHPEDVETESEDHCYDDTRYACMSRPWMTEVKKKETRVKDWFREREEDTSWRTA